MSAPPGKIPHAVRELPPIEFPEDTRMLHDPDGTLGAILERLAQVAQTRSQSPAETLSAALDALASAPSAAQAARLATLAGTRRQTVEEMLADCIRWLEEGPTSKTKKLEAAVVVPEAARPMHPDGQPYCRCDGPEEPGPWHRCHRRTVG